MDESTKIQVLSKLFAHFKTGIVTPNSTVPRKHLESQRINYIAANLGFNSGQFHHRKGVALRKEYEAAGMITYNPDIVPNKKGHVPYTSFGKYGIIYPLYNEWGDLVNFFAERFNLKKPQTEYLNRKGVYPHYPNTDIKALFLCDNPIETASLIQANILKEGQGAISLFDGALSEDVERYLETSKEIQKVYLLTSYIKGKTLLKLVERFPEREIIKIGLSKKTINGYLVSGSAADLKKEIETSSNGSVIKRKVSKEIEVVNPQKLKYIGEEAIYEVVGKLSLDLGQLRVSLRIIDPKSGKVHRCKIDLFDAQDIVGKVSLLSQEFLSDNLETDLINLTEALELYRDKLYKEELSATLSESKNHLDEFTPKAKAEAHQFLIQGNLFIAFDKLIELSGIIGEEASRKTAFVIASSYKQPYPMHGLIQASSGKGKSHLINSIASLMPTEDIINLSRITSRSLYNYQSDELMYKLILIQDEDGLDEESLYAFRELQSAGFLSSSTSAKNSFGKHQSRVTRVNAHFSSLMASTKTEVYGDNESRSIAIGIDESDEQTLRIIDYTNRVRAGLIEKKSQTAAKQLLRNCIRLLKRKEVINPYAHLIKLPLEAKTLRRLNAQFQDFVSQITILHQYQRKEDSLGRLITTREDMEIAIQTFFSSILFKVDELDSSTRQLFDRMKSYIVGMPKGKKHEFTRREIREVLNLKKTKAAEVFQHLQEMEFISISSGSSNRGFFYQIINWDERLDKLTTDIRNSFEQQLQELKRAS